MPLLWVYCGTQVEVLAKAMEGINKRQGPGTITRLDEHKALQGV